MNLSALKIIHLLQAFSNVICSTAVQHLSTASDAQFADVNNMNWQLYNQCKAIES